VQAKGLFVSFPDENAQAPTKSQLKKGGEKQKGGDPAKLAAALEAKKQKQADKAPAKEEQKNGGAGEATPSSTAPQTPVDGEKKPKQKQ
jgi:hypothetical protein